MSRTLLRIGLCSSLFVAGSGFAGSAPAGFVTVELGDVEISYWDPLEITGLEYSTNFYFTLHNTGSSAVTVNVPQAWDVSGAPPSDSSYHFYHFHAAELTLEPGEEETIEFLITNEGSATGTMRFPFSIDGGPSATAKLKYDTGAPPNMRDVATDATITGTVTADGQPLANVDVIAYAYNAREWFRGQADALGNYSVRVPAVATLRATLGDRPMPYPTYDYFVVVDEPGYSYGYTDGVTARVGASVTADVSVESVTRPEYELSSTLQMNGEHGVWWIMADAGFETFAAVQGRHPPEAGTAGEILAFDAAGKVLWRQATGDECWGFDRVGDVIAAGCHDGSVEVYDADGNELWTVAGGQQNREIEIGPKGQKVFTGPYPDVDVAMLDATTGSELWSVKDGGDWLRASRFDKRGKKIVASRSGGLLQMFNARNGNVLWERYIGEFAMVLEVDKRGNVYAAGKNREIFAHDRNGKLRWRYRIANHNITAGLLNIDKKSRRLVMSGPGGWLHCFDTKGNLLWQRRLPDGAVSQGHNALQITSNGKYLATGSNGGIVALYDLDGTLLWSHTTTDERDDVQNAQRGAIAVTISEDGSTIVAGYGDSTIRIFKRQ